MNERNSMFGFLKKKKEVSKNELKAFVTGKAITIEEVADGVFSEKILGDGMAIWPEEGKLYAPADGKVVTVMEDSKHAVGLELAGGIQILLHVGIDTVEMNGKGFTYHISEGQDVKMGDLLIEFDRETIKTEGCKDVVVMVVVENNNECALEMNTGCAVTAKDSVILSY